MSTLCLRSLDTNELLTRIFLGSCSELEAELARRLELASEYIADLEDHVEMLAVLLEPDEAEQTTPHLH